MELPLIHFDCKYFMGDRPCFANKQYGVFCHECKFYEKDETITGQFPAIKTTLPENKDEKFTKIIIVKLDAVGDVLRTTSILPTLKDKYSDSSITWITKEKSYGVLEGNELIDEIYFDTDELSHVFGDLFDIAINLDSGKESCLIMNEINSTEKFGYILVYDKPYPVNSFANEWYLMGVNDNYKKNNKKTYHEIIHEICNFSYTGSKPHLGISREKRKRMEFIKNKFGLEGFADLILVNLGGGNRWQYKKWTKEGYVELINRLCDMKLDSAIGIVAGEEDKDFYRAVLEELKSKVNIVQFGYDNPIEDFICIVALSGKVFTSDSLAFHIATALNNYVIVVVGPTSHTELDVFDNGKIIYSEQVDCLCCYLNKCDKSVTCMNTVTAEEILKNLI